MAEKSVDQIVADVQAAKIDANAAARFDTVLSSIDDIRTRNQAGDTAVGVLDTLQTIGSIPLAVLPNYELADAARNSQILDQLRSDAYLREREEDAAAVQRATEEGGEWAGLVEGAARAATGGNTFADVMAQSPYLMIGPAARAMGFASSAAAKGVLARGLAAVGGDTAGALATRVAALSAVLEGSSSYGQTYERVLRETGDPEEATRQARIAGGTALVAGGVLGRLTPKFEIDPFGRTNKVASQFLGSALLPTATAVGGEVVEEGGMAITNTVTDNVLNGRDPMEGVGGAVGEAAAISSLFTGGIRSPALVRDISKAIGLGVRKGLVAAGSAFAGRAQTPEGAATKAAREANVAAVDEVLQAAVGTEGGDPASTGASTDTVAPTKPNTSEDNTTQPRESASLEDEDQLGEEERQYQLRQKGNAAPVDPESDAGQILTLAETESLVREDDSAESAAAAERAAELAPTIAQAEQRVFDFSSKAEDVAEVVAKADAGDAKAQDQVEAIAVVNPLALPTKTFPKALRPLVEKLRALRKAETDRVGTLTPKALETRQQILESGWENTTTGKKNKRLRGMAGYVDNMLQGLARGNAKDSKEPTKQAVTAAAFLQHLRSRGALFAEALKLRDEILEQGEAHPLYQETLKDNAIPIKGTRTLGKDGKLTDKPFMLYLSGRAAANSVATVEAAVEDVVAAEEVWEAFENQFPQMAEAAGIKGELQRQKVKDIIASRQKKKAPVTKTETEINEEVVLDEIGKSTDTKRLKALSDRLAQRAQEGKLAKESADRIRKAYDVRMQQLLSEKIVAATEQKDLDAVAQEIGGLGDEVADTTKAALRKEWRAKKAELDKAKEPAPPTPAPTVNVWFGSGQNGELSNLALRPFTFEGREYYSVEHAYQTLKGGVFNEGVYANPRWKKGGVKINGGQTKTDGNFNITLMKSLVKESFVQNPEAAKALLATGDKTITHEQDRGIWKSEFPRILMEVRSELAKAPPTAPATPKPAATSASTPASIVATGTATTIRPFAEAGEIVLEAIYTDPQGQERLLSVEVDPRGVTATISEPRDAEGRFFGGRSIVGTQLQAGLEKIIGKGAYAYLSELVSQATAIEKAGKEIGEGYTFLEAEIEKFAKGSEAPPTATATPAPAASPTRNADERVNFVLRIARNLDVIKSIIPNFRWAQKGGEGYTDGEGKVGRTTWLADPAIDPWWSRGLGLSMEKTKELFEKLSRKVNQQALLDGVTQEQAKLWDKLGKNQRAVIEAFLEFMDAENAAQDAARRQAEENRAENEREAQLEREGRDIDSRAAGEGLAGTNTGTQPAGIPDGRTDSDTGQEPGAQSQNPLSQITNWFKDFPNLFNIDPTVTLEGWIEKFRAAGTLGDQTIYDALYANGIEETYQNLKQIIEQGLKQATQGEDWKDKPYGVGSYLYQIIGKNSYQNSKKETIETDVYGVPEPVLRAFATAAVIVLYKNAASFSGITTEKGLLAREVQKEAMAADIATVAKKLLGISSKQDTSITVDQGTFLSYGLSSVAALIAGQNFQMREGFKKGDTYTNDNLHTVAGVVEENVEAPVQVVVQVVIPVKENLKLARDWLDSLDQVQGVLGEERIWEVSNEPITEVDKTIQYDGTPLSPAQETANTNLQAVEHNLFPGLHQAYLALGNNGMSRALTGWWEADLENLEALDHVFPESVKEWLTAQGNRLRNEFAAIKKYLEVTENGAKGLFFKYRFGLNGRPKTVNGPQNLKIVRDLFSTGKATLDLMNPKHHQAIMMTLAQAFGVKTDINSPEMVMQIWNGEDAKQSFVAKKKELEAKARKILAARKEDGSFDKVALTAALRQDKPYTPRELAALITWSEILANPNNREYTSHLMFEIDGKTNGAFNTELFFGLAAHSYANLAQGGMFPGKHDATWQSEHDELQRNGGSDFYERLNITARNVFIEQMRNDLIYARKHPEEKSSKFVRPNILEHLRLLEAADLIEVQWTQTRPGDDIMHGIPLFTLKRDAAKFAVIPIQYGAGRTGVANQLWSDVVHRINAKYIRLYNELQRTQNGAIEEQLGYLAEILNGYDTRGKEPGRLPKEDQQDAWRWQKALSRIASAMSVAYKSQKPTVQQMTDTIVKLTAFAYAVKKWQVDRNVNEIKLAMPENQALIAKYGEKARLFEPSKEQYRDAMYRSIDLMFSVLNAPNSVHLNSTEWKNTGVDVSGIGTPMNANMDVPELSVPGVRILALITIAGGDAAVGTHLFQTPQQLTHVFDGFDLSPLDLETVGNLLNEGVWQTAMFNILADIGAMAEKIEAVVVNADNAAITTMAKHYNDSLPPELRGVSTEDFVKLMGETIGDFENLYRNQRVGQRVLESQPNTVYQYGGSGEGYNTPVRDSAAIDDEIQLSLEEDTPRQDVTDLSQVGEREEGLYKDQRKEADATRLEDENGLIDVVMKGPRWRGTNSYTPDTAEPDTWKRDGLSHGLRRLIKVLHMAAAAGVAYDSDQSVSPDAIKMYLRGKRAGIITFDSPYTDEQLDEAVANGVFKRTTNATTFTGPSVFSNVRLVGREAITTRTPNPTIQSAFDISGNQLNKAGVIAALDKVQWKNPIHRAVWKRIRNLLPEALMVYLATTPEQWLEGSKITGTRRAFNSVTGVAIGSKVLLRVPSAETMLHELIHTIFTKHIDNFFTNINLVPVELRGPINDLVQLMEKFKALPGIGRVGFIQKVMRSYAFRGQPQDELGEMLAYVFTEERIISELSPGFVDRVKTRIKQIFGFITKVPTSTKDFYNEAMDVFRQLTDNVPMSEELVDSGPVRMSDRVVDDQFESLAAMTDRAYENQIARAARGVNVDFTGLKADVDKVTDMVKGAFQLSPAQLDMFGRVYGLLRHGPRGAELEQFVSTTFTKHAQKNLFNKAPDVTAAVLALAAVEPAFAAQLDALWNTREQESKVDQVIGWALNGTEQTSSTEMVNAALAGMLMDTETSNSFYGTAASRLDRLGSSVLNRLGELAWKGSEKAPKFIDDGLYIISALLSEKRASAFGETLLGYVNTQMSSQAVRDVVAALLGTKGSGKLTYRAHNAMITLINQTRSMFDNTLPRELAKLFPADFDGWSRLYSAFGQLDVAVLGTSAERMYRDDAERRRMIEVLKSKVDNWIDAENLGYFLVHHDVKPNTTLNLLRNARAIANNLNGIKQKPSEELVADVDQLVTLFAIEALPASERATVANYFTQHRDSMNKLVGMLKHIKDTELADMDPRYENVTWKVSLPLSTDPRNSTVIGNSIKGATLLALGYTRGEKYPQTSGDPESDLYYYHRKWSPPAVFTQGIVATVQQTMSGINFASAASITPEVGTMLASRQAVNYINRHKGRGSKLIPIHNLNGDVAGYERLLDPAIVRKTLGAENTMLHVAIGKKLGRITEEKLAKQVNQEAIKIMYDTWKADEEANRGDQYEVVNSTTDKQVARAWENIPGPIKAQLEEVFGGQVMVRRDLLSNTIGYHNAGVLEIYTGDASLDPKTRKALLGMLQTVFIGPKGTQILLASEQAIKEGVATAKDLIIVRSIVVAWQNMQASAHLVLANGVPPAKLFKLYREGMADVQSYNRLQREVMQLRIEIAGTTNPVEQERLRALQLTKRNAIRRLRIYPLIAAGELSDLPEGLEESPSHSYLGDLSGWMNNHLRRVHPKAPAIVANAIFAKDSAIHDALSKTIQAGDFLARYAIYQHMIDQGVDPEKALDDVRDELISYQTNPGRMRAALESYGMIWWSQFTLRAQSVLLNRFRKNPFSFFVSQALGDFMGTPGPLDGALLERGLDTSLGIDNVFSAPSAIIHAKVF